VMGAEGAVNILYGREIAAASDPAETRRGKVEEYQDAFANPWVAAWRGYVDDVIAPRPTRRRLIRALDLLANKRDVMPPKKHGNMPLLRPFRSPTAGRS